MADVSNRYFFRHYTWKEYLMQIIKNQNLLFVKTKNRNVQIKNSWMQFAHEK